MALAASRGGAAAAPEGFSLARRRLVFATAAIGYVLSQFYRSFLAVIVDDLGRDLGLGPKEFGYLGGAWFIAFGVSQLLVGVLLDRFGPRRTICGLMIFAVSGAFLFAQSANVLSASLAMGLIGLGCSPVLMGALYFFARTEPPGRFAALSSLFLGVGLLGGLLSSSPMALMVEMVGWRDAIRVMGAATFVSLGLIALTLRDPPMEAADSGDQGAVFGALAVLLRQRALWPILFMSTFITAEVFSERALWVGPFLRDVHGLAALERGHAILAFASAMAVSAMLAGPIAGAIGNPKRVVIVGTSVTVLGFLALAAFPRLSLEATVLVLVGIGLFGVTYAVQIAHARQFMPNHVIGRGITFVNFLSISTTGLLQFLSGQAVEAMKRADWPPDLVYARLHLGFGLLLLAALIVYSFSKARP